VTAAAPTGLVAHPDCELHDTGPGHPERAARLRAILARLADSGLERHLAREDARAIDPALLARVHAPGYVAEVEGAITRGARLLDEGDTRVSAGSWRAALLAAGGAVQAVERVLSGAWSNAFVAVRPPGHHAERSGAMGFCVFNNVAVAAAHLRAAHGLERVAIVDWDVHHGNGTQHLFEDDPRVFFASLHQWPLYPGTGLASERGTGAGAGFTLNCPQPPGGGDREWLAAYEGSLLPALERFDPQFVLVSAGFDAHARDPLAQTNLSTDAYRRMARGVLDLARERCGGRVVALLEGGYDLGALAESAEACVAEMVSARGGAGAGPAT
jgi:acetoin utilization deacetylase AcuC-like enzyme